MKEKSKAAQNIVRREVYVTLDQNRSYMTRANERTPKGNSEFYVQTSPIISK